MRFGLYVILAHHWDGVHFDFMLEDGDALETWSLSHPPSPGEPQPAAHRPRHRLDYLEYEGPVSGHRGHVVALDRGRYRAEIWTESHVRVVLEGGQVTGVVELRRPDGVDTGDPWLFLLVGKVV